MSWQPSYAFLCASCHLAWGIIIGLVPAFLWMPEWIGPALLLAWAVPKEFVYDLADEGDSLAGSVTDFAWYVAGGAAACGLMWLRMMTLVWLTPQ